MLFFFLENSNDPCRQLTTARSVECALWTVQKPSVFRALLQTKTAKCNYFSGLMLWKCCSKNSCKKIKLRVFPHRIYTLHLSPFVNKLYEWTPSKHQSAALPLVLFQLYFCGKHQRTKWKESFQLTTCIRSTKQCSDNNRNSKHPHTKR